jgi:hypothetical protein
VNHPWFECEPCLVVVDGSDAEMGAPMAIALSVVWSAMDDLQRHRFHKFTCENNRTAPVVMTMLWMNTMLAEEAARRG